MQKQHRMAFEEFGLAWYDFARDPAHTPQEELVLFFQNVWVVSFSGVRNTTSLLRYQDSIRRLLGSTYPAMCRELAVSPAMVQYLNLNQNRKGSPNENFARELFELFCLGEGNYTENDIKEAARALTGYTLNRRGQVAFRPGRHDPSPKTIFGRTANYDLPTLIELVFEQPAAARFLPQELARFYLTDEGLPAALIQPLADAWARADYAIPHLLQTFFSARIFYADAYRGNMIKSPVHFFLGLLQDLDLDVFPSQRRTNRVMRRMGQAFFNPPNVRGWVGGRYWINSATLGARRQLVQSLLEPVAESELNADELQALEQAKAAGRTRFSVAQADLESLVELSPAALARELAGRFHVQPDPLWLETLFSNLGASMKGRDWLEACLYAALTTPPYHLC